MLFHTVRVGVVWNCLVQNKSDCKWSDTLDFWTEYYLNLAVWHDELRNMLLNCEIRNKLRFLSIFRCAEPLLDRDNLSLISNLTAKRININYLLLGDPKPWIGHNRDSRAALWERDEVGVTLQIMDFYVGLITESCNRLVSQNIWRILWSYTQLQSIRLNISQLLIYVNHPHLGLAHTLVTSYFILPTRGSWITSNKEKLVSNVKMTDFRWQSLFSDVMGIKEKKKNQLLITLKDILWQPKTVMNLS